MDLDRLEQQIEASLATHVPVRLSLADLDLPELPAFLWPLAGLQLADAAYERVSSTALAITGHATLPVLGEVDVTIAASTGQPPVSAKLDVRQPPDLRALLRSILPVLDVMGEIFEAMQVASVVWQSPTAGSLLVELGLTGRRDWTLAGMSLGVSLQKGRLMFDSGDLDVYLEGRVSLGDVDAPLKVTIANGKVDASAQVPDINLKDLASAMKLPMPALPGLDLVERALDRLEILFREGEPLLVFNYDTPLGLARCVVAKENGEFSLVAGLHAANLRFANLNSALAPLDAVLKIVAFADPAISFASRELPSFPFPVAGGGWRSRRFAKGVQINGELLFDGFGLELIETLFGISRLPLAIPIGGDWSQVRIAAALDHPIKILGDLATVDPFTVSVSPEPLQVAVAGEVLLKLFGAELPRLTLGAALAPGTADLFLVARDAWKEPLGIPVSINEIGFQMSSTPAYGILGTITIQDRKLDVAAQFTGQVPSLFAGKLDGEMPLGDLLFELAGIDLLPDYIQPTIKDFDLYIVLNPVGGSVAGRMYPFGLSLRGTLSLLGLGFTTDLHISKSQIRAKGELDKPIRMEPFFRLSGVDQEAPSFALDTMADPIATVDGRIMLLGLEQTVTARLGTAGFDTLVEQKLGPVEARLAVNFGHGQLAALGDIDCKVTGRIGPIRLFDGGPDLGTISLDTGAELSADIKIVENGPLAMKVGGRITIVGMNVTLPEFAVDVSSLDQLPQALLEYIRDHVVELLGDLFSDVGLWLKAIADKLIESVENVARALSEHFKRTSQQIAEAMLDVLDDTVEVTAKALKDIGEKVEEIGRILNRLGRTDEEVANALRSIGAAPEVIGNVLKELGRGTEEIGKVLKNVGFPDAAVDVALRLVFPGIPGVGWPPHIKHVKLPHVKHVKLPHVKHVKLPHVKHVKVPHLKHVKIF